MGWITRHDDSHALFSGKHLVELMLGFVNGAPARLWAPPKLAHSLPIERIAVLMEDWFVSLLCSTMSHASPRASLPKPIPLELEAAVAEVSSEAEAVVSSEVEAVVSSEVAAVEVSSEVEEEEGTPLRS